jgi:hypothetical protein
LKNSKLKPPSVARSLRLQLLDRTCWDELAIEDTIADITTEQLAAYVAASLLVL